MAQKRNPQVAAARTQARQAARAQGLGQQGVQRAGRQAARSTRQSLRQPVPQPPAAPDYSQGSAGGFQYSPTAESQLNQPYQDAAARGAMGELGGTLSNFGNQMQLGNLYGQGAASNLGQAADAMQPLGQMGMQGTGLGAGTLGQYGQLMSNNVPIQQGIANEIQAIQSGKTDVDPAMLQQFDQQQRALEGQARQQLGPDWASSSAGIEAMGRFQQGKQTALASANFNRLQGLYGMQQQGLGNLTGQGINLGQFGQGVQGQQFGQGAQLGQMFGQNAMDLYNQAMGMRSNQLGGANQMLNQLAQIQALYAGIPQTMGQFGQAMSGQAGAAVGAQGPYQQDRLAALGAAAYPTKGQYGGLMLQNQGDRLISSASAMGGGGGGSPQFGSSMGGGGGGGWSMGGY